MSGLLERIVLETSAGKLWLTSNGAALTGLSFAAPKAMDAPQTAATSDDAILREACRQLQAYFAGTLRSFDLPLAPHGTAFQQRVWQALREIPFGETRSYRDLARRIGNVAACRAVGAANGRNPIGIVVPCHRVIGADGSLTGFGGGLEMKRWLLEHEAQSLRLLETTRSAENQARGPASAREKFRPGVAAGISLRN